MVQLPALVASSSEVQKQSTHISRRHSSNTHISRRHSSTLNPWVIWMLKEYLSFSWTTLPVMHVMCCNAMFNSHLQSNLRLPLAFTNFFTVTHKLILGLKITIRLEFPLCLIRTSLLLWNGKHMQRAQVNHLQTIRLNSRILSFTFFNMNTPGRLRRTNHDPGKQHGNLIYALQYSSTQLSV